MLSTVQNRFERSMAEDRLKRLIDRKNLSKEAKMKKYFDFESVLSLIDKAINPQYLNPTQEIVLREVWKGKTYSEMAYEYNYDPEYIKSVGCSLWQVLSRAFDNQINKSNFVPFMRQKLTQLVEEKDSRLQNTVVESTSTEENRQVYHWTMAPNIKHFIGREEEIATLESWSQEVNSRCIVVSGTIGCGKTTLVTKFAQKYRDRFDYVIWFSLLDAPALKTLIHNYLAIITQPQIDKEELESLELSVLLSNFIDCLKKQRILLILDGLQSILKLNQTNTSCQKQFEEYSKFLRSVISTNHQSLLLTTSRIKPNFLEYYSSNQVKFLDLQGIKPETASVFLSENNTTLEPEKLLFLATVSQGNFCLLKIIEKHLDSFIEEDSEQTLQDISLLPEVGNFLDLELSYCSDLKKEILFWLSISCKPVTLEDLKQHIEQSQSKLEFLQSINCLTERSLVIKSDRTYTLMPIMKAYLRRKLVRVALQDTNS